MTSIERIYLIRHGETEWNASGRWQGSIDVALNEHGRNQAHELAAYLSDRPFGSIYSSDLSRAYETATLLGAVYDLIPHKDARLREINLGVFQGLTRDEMIAQYPDEWEALSADLFNYVLEGGESRRQVQERAYAAWLDIVRRGIGPDVAVIAHGVTLRVLMMKLFSEVMPEIEHQVYGNTSITTLTRDGTAWKIVELNAMPHLAPREVVTMPVKGEANAS